MDRLAVAVRYVKEDGLSFAVKERLLEVKETTDKTGNGQASDILTSLEDNGLKVSELIFQSYDFASNMSGVHNGAQAEIEKKLDRKVPYIPCQAHRCNTVVEHACESSHIIQELFNILQELYDFFSGSTKRHAIIANHLEQVENCLQLRNLSKTRWTARAESIKAVWTSLEAIVKALEEAFAVPKLYSKIKAMISALLKNVKSFDFIVSLMFMKNIMFKTKILSESLQQEELNIMDALQLTKATVTSLERINNKEAKINDMIDAAVLYMKTSFQVDTEEVFTRSHRVRRIPRRYDDNPLGTTAFIFHQYYRKEFKCVLDVLISQFRDKMQPTLDATAPIAHALQVPLHEPSPEMIQKLTEMFPSDVDPDVLEAELEVFRNIVDRTEELKNGSTNNIVQFAYEQTKVLPLTWKAYQLMLTAPISVSKDERTFSHLKFVKNVYRSIMGDKRLDNLMLLNCEKDLTDDLDMYHVLNLWASKPRR